MKKKLRKGGKFVISQAACSESESEGDSSESDSEGSLKDWLAPDHESIPAERNSDVSSDDDLAAMGF